MSKTWRNCGVNVMCKTRKIMITKDYIPPQFTHLDSSKNKSEISEDL